MIFKPIFVAFLTSSKTVIALVDTDLLLMKKIDPKSDIHPPNVVTSSQDFLIEFGRTGSVLSTWEPPIQNRRVGTYFTVLR